MILGEPVAVPQVVIRLLISNMFLLIVLDLIVPTTVLIPVTEIVTQPMTTTSGYSGNSFLHKQ